MHVNLGQVLMLQIPLSQIMMFCCDSYLEYQLSKNQTKELVVINLVLEVKISKEMYYV